MHPETSLMGWHKPITCAAFHRHGQSFEGWQSRGWYIKGLEPSGDHWHEETPEKPEGAKVKVGEKFWGSQRSQPNPPIFLPQEVSSVTSVTVKRSCCF